MHGTDLKTHNKLIERSPIFFINEHQRKSIIQNKKEVVVDRMDLRSFMSLLIGISLCFSLWHIMIQQQQYIVSTSSLSPSSSFANDSFVINESPLTLMTEADTTIETISTIYPDLLPKNDFRKLIDLNNFEFLMNPKTCKDLVKSPLVLILVHSAPDNIHKRQTIRETWGRNDTHSLLLFLLGSVNSTTMNEKLIIENQVYGDLVQGNFKDTYRNMTYKHVMALKWLIYECPKARFLLKTDDDVFINSPLLFNILENPSMPLHQPLNRDRLIYCHRIERAKVKRSYRSKWRVTYKEYSGRYFPYSCPGFAILYSNDAVFSLYQETQKLPYFWIDDVHVTGTAAANLNLSITPFDKMYLDEFTQRNLISGQLKVEGSSSFLFAQPNLVKVEIEKLWKLVENTANTIKSVET